MNVEDNSLNTSVTSGECLSLKDVFIDKRAVECIPESLASTHILMPIIIHNDRIKIAMVNPIDVFALEDVRMASGYEVEAFKASREEIKSSIKKYYSNQYIINAAEEILKEQRTSYSDGAAKIEKDSVKTAPAVRIVDMIIKKAIESRASDIHLEPFEKQFKIRYRIDGELKETEKCTIEVYNSIVSRIKVLGNMNTAEKRLPQDGKINIPDGINSIDCRVSTLPTMHGEKVVIRILRKEGFLISKDNLGLSNEELIILNKITKKSHGLILVTGPTGSGKTTTLYSILNEFKTSRTNIVTIEDPIEFAIEGINQVNVNSNIGLTFGTGLRSILRQDPDVIMIGEIRDSETAEIAIRAAITGHVVLSTIHTNDATSALIRLSDMGIEGYLLASAISGVISQRLIKKICPFCRYEYNADRFEKEMLGIHDDSVLKLYRGRTCHKCDYTGYYGRTGIFELMEITKYHRELISNNYTINDIKDLCIDYGMKSLKDSCKQMVLSGTTTIDELIKIDYLID
jgi:type IV pilus assembly protein PilB